MVDNVITRRHVPATEILALVILMNLNIMPWVKSFIILVFGMPSEMPCICGSGPLVSSVGGDS
jgi:hypothetical protein